MPTDASRKAYHERVLKIKHSIRFRPGIWPNMRGIIRGKTHRIGVLGQYESEGRIRRFWSSHYSEIYALYNREGIDRTGNGRKAVGKPNLCLTRY